MFSRLVAAGFILASICVSGHESCAQGGGRYGVFGWSERDYLAEILRIHAADQINRSSAMNVFGIARPILHASGDGDDKGIADRHWVSAAGDFYNPIRHGRLNLEVLAHLVAREDSGAAFENTGDILVPVSGFCGLLLAISLPLHGSLHVAKGVESGIARESVRLVQIRQVDFAEGFEGRFGKVVLVWRGGVDNLPRRLHSPFDDGFRRKPGVESRRVPNVLDTIFDPRGEFVVLEAGLVNNGQCALFDPRALLVFRFGQLISGQINGFLRGLAGNCGQVREHAKTDNRYDGAAECRSRHYLVYKSLLAIFAILFGVSTFYVFNYGLDKCRPFIVVLAYPLGTITVMLAYLAFFPARELAYVLSGP